MVEVRESHVSTLPSVPGEAVPGTVTAMEGYDATTYGRAFADVYDDWYEGITDTAATVAVITDLALTVEGRHAGTPARVLELGVGTGRLALPLADDDRLRVVGIDASGPMLTRLAERDTDGRVTTVLGDMVDDLPDGPFELVFVAYNTLFNITAEGGQQRCFDAVAARLAPGGRFVVEAFIPDEPPRDGDDITIRSMTADRVVLSVSRRDGARQLAEGHFVELTDGAPVRLRPWSIRYATPQQLDEMADVSGLVLESRWADMAGTPISDDDDRHVTVYRRVRHDLGTGSED